LTFLRSAHSLFTRQFIGAYLKEFVMSDLEVGSIVADFTLPVDSKSGESLTFSKIGGPSVVYFYPKDDTPGCTKEAIAFTAQKKEFDALGVKIIGISKDKVAKHDKFIDKHSLDLTLIADEEGTACAEFGVWVEKNLYGRKYMGIERATFLIDAEGKVLQVWRKVKVKEHVEAVLSEAQKHFA
jgi:peroxiredoxin Q/BCP